MEIDGAVRARLRVLDPGPLDCVLAVLLTVGALLDAASQPHRGLDALAAVSLVVATSGVAWRRGYPVLATLVAIGALTAFQLASSYNGDGSVEGAASWATL